MFGDVWRWAGKPRTCDLNLGVPHQHVEARLYDLLKNLEHWAQGGVSSEEQAVMLHHQAVLIHPFLNGNGRWARLLANVWLKRNGSAPTQWPEATVGTQSTARAEYLKAIRAADEGDYEPLLQLHRQFTPSE
jgi:fido (protein-threonine AMPylation protein)